MAGLQRSTTSFRRQGSSGLVWDDKNLSGELSNVRNKEKGDLQTSQILQRSRSEGTYRTGKGPPPALDPPSPKVSGCGICGIFSKPAAATARKPKSNKRRS